MIFSFYTKWFSILLLCIWIHETCDRPSLNRGGGVWHHLAATYNVALASLPRQFNTHSHSCDPNVTQDSWARPWMRPTSIQTDAPATPVTNKTCDLEEQDEASGVLSLQPSYRNQHVRSYLSSAALQKLQFARTHYVLIAACTDMLQDEIEANFTQLSLLHVWDPGKRWLEIFLSTSWEETWACLHRPPRCCLLLHWNMMMNAKASK